jgi:hypothetical protein
MDEFKRQLEHDAKERAELWERLLQHDEIELELSRQKESMEQVYITKHQKVNVSNSKTISFLIFISFLKKVIGGACRPRSRINPSEKPVYEERRFFARTG